jgi:hypothetical protein
MDAKLKLCTVWMTVSFLAVVSLVAGIITASVNGVPHDTLDRYFWIAVVFYIIYLIFLGHLGALLNRNGTLYVLAAIFIAPAGSIYTFFRMLFNVWQARNLSTATAIKTSSGPLDDRTRTRRILTLLLWLAGAFVFAVVFAVMYQRVYS